MKHLFCSLLLALAGCQSAPPVATLPKPAAPMAAMSRPAPTPGPVVPDDSALRQRQLIEALINQNDALTARLAALSAGPSAAPLPPSAPFAPTMPIVTPAPIAAPMPIAAPAPVPPPAPVPVAATPAGPVAAAVEPSLAPNADGLIDLVAAARTPVSEEDVNPFAVRLAAPEKTREIKLRVNGTVGGARPCAVVNDRLLGVGESVEGFSVERIEAESVLLKHENHRLKLPVGEDAVRVRLPN